MGRQCPLVTLRTVFNCFPEEDALGQGLAPGQGLAAGQGINNNSYNNNGCSNSVHVASGMTEVALVPAAAVADRPRLSCASLRYPPCDPPEDCGVVDDGNTATGACAGGAGVGGGGGADASQVNVDQQLAWLIQHLRRRSRYKQELRVVWSDEYGSIDSDRLGTRLVEDR